MQKMSREYAGFACMVFGVKGAKIKKPAFAGKVFMNNPFDTKAQVYITYITMSRNLTVQNKSPVSGA